MSTEEVIALRSDAPPARQLSDALPGAWASARRLVVAHRAEAAAALLLALMCVNLVSAVSRKTITNDEIVHIPAGYYHLVDGYFQLNNEHPPLVKMWAAVPLLLLQPSEPPARGTDERENFTELTWGYHARFWPENRARFETITFWARVWMIPLTLALGALIFVFARGLFGARAGLLAVALYTLEPTVLAHGRVVHTDLPAALVYLLFFVTLRRYLAGRTLRRALAVGLACGVALATKFSMVVLLPVLCVVALVGLWRGERAGMTRGRVATHACAAALTALLVVNAAYYFTRPPVEPADVGWVKMRSGEAADEWLAFFRAGSKVVPTYFLFGSYNVMLHNRDGHPTSLLGEYSREGWWYYFPVAFALKTSLPFLLLSVAALAWALWRLARRRDARFAWVVAPFAVFAALCMTSHINIGVRHFLPAYPFLFVAAGALADRLLRVRYPRRPAVALVVLSFGWMSVEALRAFPDYVPYMNQLASSHPRWWYLSDSNVEWGDDLRALAEYLKARGETDVRGALSGGWGILGQYGVAYHEMFPRPGVRLPETRYVAVGASFLNGSTIAVPPDEQGRLIPEEERPHYLAEYRTATPEAVFGGTIYLYRVK